MKMGRMSWMMMAGCSLALIAFVLLPALGVRLSGVLPYLLVLACPLSHFVMMAFMGRGHDHSSDNAHHTEEDSGRVEGGETAVVRVPVESPTPGGQGERAQ